MSKSWSHRTMSSKLCRSNSVLLLTEDLDFGQVLNGNVGKVFSQHLCAMKNIILVRMPIYDFELLGESLRSDVVVNPSDWPERNPLITLAAFNGVILGGFSGLIAQCHVFSERKRPDRSSC